MAVDPGFCAPGLDRADRLRSDPDGLRAAMMRPSARLLRMNGLDPVISDHGALDWGSIAEADPECDLILLGLDGETSCFAAVPQHIGPGQPVRQLWQGLASFPERDAAIATFLARSDNVTVGYRCNRAVLFDSNLFHRSDEFAFDDTFEGWRTTMTFLFGDRGRAAMSEGLGLI